MKKLTKFGIITMSVFVLNLVSQSVAQADETNSGPAETLVTLGVTNTTGSVNSASEDNNVAEGTSNGEATTTDKDKSTCPAGTSTGSAPGASCEPDGSNIIDEGGYVNVEGLPAHFSEDGKSVVYNYTVAFKGMHSSDRGQTVSGLRVRIPEIVGSKVDFTLIGTRDANENPVDVNVPMKELSFNEYYNKYIESTNVEGIVPTAEELAAGKKPSIVNMNDYEYSDGYSEFYNDKVNIYAVGSTTLRSTALRVSVTVPLEEAKKIKYLPIDARFQWKCSQEGGIGSYEEGCQIMVTGKLFLMMLILILRPSLIMLKLLL